MGKVSVTNMFFFSHNVFWSLTLFRMTILDSSKQKEFPDNNFKVDENCRKFSTWVENTAGKSEIARNEQFLLFP